VKYKKPFRQRVEEFVAAVTKLEEKHGVELGHQDSHGAFLYGDANIPWGPARSMLSEDAVQCVCVNCGLPYDDHYTKCETFKPDWAEFHTRRLSQVKHEQR
jgi:hypothetical protein